MPANKKVNSDQRGIVDILLERGQLTADQAKKVKLEMVNQGKSGEELILSHNYAGKASVMKAKAESMGVGFVDVSTVGIAPEAVSMIPESVAKRYQVLPFAIDDQAGVLSVAMTEPNDLETIDFVQSKVGMKVKPFMAIKDNLKPAIDRRYSESLSGEVSEALEQGGVVQQGIKTIDADSLGDVIKEAPIAKIVSTILQFAIKARASDVHIEPQESKTRIRYRIDGILREKLVLPKSVHEAVVSRIKILADMKIDEKRMPQDGRFNFVMGEQEVDLRVSSMPTVNGEKMVMRLLKKTGRAMSLPELGLRGKALSNLRKIIQYPHGIILVTGPTGSGKTTTLYSTLSILNTSRVNIMTLEDPVEYQMAGINQIQVNPQAGLTFASGLRSFLRQDPNIIMVGEIRDEETAGLAVQAALTGHLVMSTLHTNSAAGALPRLLDMKAEPYLLASSILTVVAQRVVRRVCTSCRQAYVPEEKMVEDIGKVLGSMYEAWRKTHEEQVRKAEEMKGEIVLYKGGKEGCKECGGTGYKGRVGIFEVMKITDKISKLILERASSGDIQKQAVEDGMMLMDQDGYLKALDGITTLEEVLRVARQ